MALTAKKVYAILKRQISDMEAKIKTPIIYRGTVATADLLPLNPDIGDMYNIESKSIYGEAGMNVAWNGVVWDTMGAPIDMSLYIKSSELSDWVKQQTKPTYTAEEVGALPADTKIPSKTSDLQNDSGFLTKIPDNYLSGTDKTLNVSGKAADAKATGDKITELSADISNKLNKNQGSENSGKIAGINESGDIVPMFPVSVDYNEETNCLEFGSDQKMELNKGINLDNTLTKTGYAADAGTVGEITNSLKEDINNKIITDSSINKANPNEYSDGVVIEGKISSLKQGYRHTGYIECKKKDIIRTIRSANISEYYIVEYYDSNKTYVTNSYTLAQENEVAEFTVPDNNEITHCRVNFRIENQDTFMVTINTPYPTGFKPYYHVEYLNNISEKTIKGTILFSGDSICYGAGYSGGYATIIQKRNPLATVVNYGVSGTTVAKRNGRSDSILERLDTMQSNADFVIFEGGINDAWDETVEIGTFNKSANVDSTTTFNEETFSGALESLFNKAYKKYPKAHIMFVIVSVSDNYSTYEYLNRAKEICEKWKVTPIDIRESGLNLMIKECVSLYGAGGTDGTHPSKLGYEKFFVPMIESEIKKYL